MSFEAIARALLSGSLEPRLPSAPEPSTITPLARARVGDAGAALCAIARSDGGMEMLLGLFEHHADDGWCYVGDAGGSGDWLLRRPDAGVVVGSSSSSDRARGALVAVAGVAADDVGELSMSAAGTTVPVEIASESGCFVGLVLVPAIPVRAELAFSDGGGARRHHVVDLGEDD
jgi:hypothetical protein